MATVLVQTKAQNSGGYNNTNAATLTSSVAAGNLLVLAVTAGAADTIATVADNRGNTWTLIDSAIGGDRTTWLYYAKNTAAGSTIVTVTFGSGMFPDSVVIVREYSGLDTTAPYDKTAKANSGTSYVNTITTAATTTTAQANELVVVAAGSGAQAPTWAAGSGFGNLADQGGFDLYTSGAMEDKTLTSTGTQTGTFDTTSYSRNQAVLATFKEVVASPPSTPTGLTSRPGNTINTLKWNPVSTATSYTLARATTSGGTLTNIYTGANTTFADTGRTNGTPYYYKVLATNTAGSSSNSTEVIGTSAVPAPNGTYAWHPFGTQPSVTIANLQSKTRAQYDNWFNFTMTSGGMPVGMPAGAKRIAVPDQIIYPATAVNSTVSEGIGYGLFLKAAFSNPNLPVGIYDPYAKDDFDSLFTYYNYFKNANGLMKWSIDASGTPLDGGGATDGDLDAAMGLVLMSRLHGNGGTVAYTTEATTLINAIMNYEVVPTTGYAPYANVLTNGDGWGFGTDNMMPDYMRAGFFREFYYFTGNTRWLDVYNVNMDLMIKYYHDTYSGGVVPDRQTRTHTTITTAQDKPTYNSVRLGFGLAYDYLWNGTASSITVPNMLNKMANKAKANWTTGAAVKAPDYADLNMSAGQAYSNLSGYGMVAPAALISSTNQTFATEIFNAMDVTTEFASSYFNGGVGLMAMVAMSGIAQPIRNVKQNSFFGGQ